MSTRNYESLVRGTAGCIAIRVWRTEPHGMPLQQFNPDIRAHLSDLHDKFMFDSTFTPSLREIIDGIASIDRVSAVEACDTSTGETLLVYIDWPN